MTRCSLCDRETSETRCACGAEIDWLSRAPEVLRAKLARAACKLGGAAVITTMGTGCGGACAPAFDAGCGISACSVDAGRDAAVEIAIDAGVDHDAH